MRLADLGEVWEWREKAKSKSKVTTEWSELWLIVKPALSYALGAPLQFTLLSLTSGKLKRINASSLRVNPTMEKWYGWQRRA